MAKSTQTNAADLYDDDMQFHVVFLYTVKRGSFEYLPRDNHTMSGRVLNEIVNANEHGAKIVRSAIAQ